MTTRIKGNGAVRVIGAIRKSLSVVDWESVAGRARLALAAHDFDAAVRAVYADATATAAAAAARALITTASRGDEIRAECDAIADLLVEKNEAYGDSALDPLRLFSRADSVEQIKVRIDDKLSRVARGQAAGEDTTLDLIGYLVLLRIAERRSA